MCDFISDQSNTHLSQLVLSNVNSNGIKLLKTSSQPQLQQHQIGSQDASIFYLNQQQPQQPKAEATKIFLNDLNMVDSSRPVLFVVLTPNDLQNLTNGGGMAANTTADSNLAKQLQYLTKPAITNTVQVNNIANNTNNNNNNHTTTVPVIAQTNHKLLFPTTTTPTCEQYLESTPANMKTIKSSPSSCSSRTSSLNLNLDDAFKLHSELESLLSVNNPHHNNSSNDHGIKTNNNDNNNNKIMNNNSQIKFEFFGDENEKKSNLPRNNIDYAIDAVLELCRQDSEVIDNNNNNNNNNNTISTSNTSSVQLAVEPILEPAKTSCSSPIKKKKKQPTKPITTITPETTIQSPTVQIKAPLQTPQSQQQPEVTNHIHQQQQLQPMNNISTSNNTNNTANNNMSKSSKARTSYISSLIANREKTVKSIVEPSTPKTCNDDSPKLQAPNNNNDDKQQQQKKPTQNIYSILANSSNLQPSSNLTNSGTGKQQQNNPVQIQPKQIKSKPQQPQKQDTPKITSDSCILLNNNNNNKNMIINPSNVVEFVLTPNNNNNNNTNDNSNKKTSNLTSHQQSNKKTNLNSNTMMLLAPASALSSPTPQSQNKLISINLNNTSENTNMNNNQHLISVDCTNLKRLLSQPIDSKPNMETATILGGNGELHMSLMEPTFDSSLIKVVVQNLDCDEHRKPQTTTKANTKKKSPPKQKSSPTTNKPKPILAAVSVTSSDEVDSAANVKPTNNKNLTKRKRNLTQSQTRKPQATKAVVEQTSTVKSSVQIKPQQIQQSPQNQQIQVENANNKPKKLKTIADIVKHQSVQLIAMNTNNSTNVAPLGPPPPPPQVIKQDSSLERPKSPNKMSNEELTVSWINHSNPMNECLTNGSNKHGADEMNIEQLLELELDTGHHQSQRENASSPIDKFIDLDDIDVNPLDCYRTQQQHQQQPKSATNLDEFNMQFSVCSTSSSGFSEPSNFSTCSSICSSVSSNNGNNGSGANSSLMNGHVGGANNNSGLFGEESSPCYTFVEHSPPLHNYNTSAANHHHQHHHHHLNPHQLNHHLNHVPPQHNLASPIIQHHHGIR